MRLIQTTTLRFAAFAFCALLFPLAVIAQSTDQNFPTAVTTNEIDGTVKARDIGDSRLTSYFYTFEGSQGDVFINVVTKNFTGDIDVFAAEGLRSLTKMVIYADGGVNETGRLIYLRKPERMILRVEGRSPNDDPATYRIKFAGSFIALSPQKTEGSPTIAQAEINAESGVRVNSVGTIVEVIPKPQPPVKEKPAAKETVAATDKKDKESKPVKTASDNIPSPTTAKVEKPKTSPVNEKPKKPVKEKVSTAKAKEKESKPTTPPAKATPEKEISEAAKKQAASETKPKKKTGDPEVKTVFKKTPKPKKTNAAETSEKKPKPPAAAEVKPPDPLASIRLVVQLKDGKVIERPMSEVQKFSVDNGILSVIAKDGSIVKYSILDVAKVTIE